MAAVIKLRPTPALAVQGTCLCGEVRYEIEGPLGPMSHCHCSMCRKHHGTPFATVVSASIASFRWIAGEKSVVLYRSSAYGHRSFCRTCGSVTPLIDVEMGLALCPAGNFQGEPRAKPKAHMFVASKAQWHTITDDLPQHAEF
jgi:hypothetical protein